MKMRMLLCLVLLLSQFSFVLAGRPNPISWEEKQVLQQVYPHIDALYAKSQYSNAHKVSWNAIKNMVRNM